MLILLNIITRFCQKENISHTAANEIHVAVNEKNY